MPGGLPFKIEKQRKNNNMNRNHFVTLLAILSIIFSNIPVYAQVSLAPTSLFIHDRAGVTTLYVSNTTQEDQEISISFEFSYPGSDSEGNLKTITDDTVSASRYGITGNLKVFPKQFILKPGAQQTVRIQSRPMPERPDGVYWTRVIVSSNSASGEIGSVPVSEGIGTKINYVFRQNIPVFYIKGKASTGLVCRNVATTVDEGKLVAVSSLSPEGNAPFNGTVTAVLSDQNGKEIALQQQTLVAYSEVLRRIELQLPGQNLPAGKYKLDFTYETVRADVSPDDLIQSAPVRHSVEINVR
jgi:P pilus assembly chaperone PapD